MRRFWGEERAFTLPEVLLIIVLMGIVFAIASSTWSVILEDRRAVSATNQLISDLRLAHGSATNRLTSYRIVIPNGDSTTYEFGPSNAATLTTRTLPDGIRATSEFQVVEFTPDGQVSVYRTLGGPKEDQCVPPTIKVMKSDNVQRNAITVICATAEVKVDPPLEEDGVG